MKKTMCLILSCGILLAGSTLVRASTAQAELTQTKSFVLISAPQKNDVIIKEKKMQYENKLVSCDVIIPVIDGMKDTIVQKKINRVLENGIIDYKTDLEMKAKRDSEKLKNSGLNFEGYVVKSNYKITYNKSNLLSIIITNSSSTGGTLGNIQIKAYNFDLTTGNTVFLESFFKNDPDYRNVIINKITNQISKNSAKYYKNATNIVYKMPQDINFYIKDDAIGIIYQNSEIAPYKQGNPKFEIPFSDFKNGVNLDINIKDPSGETKKIGF